MGLFLEIKPNGTKAWRYRFELAGKESVYAIGDYPAVSLSDARVERQKARDQVKEGHSPVRTRQLDRIKRPQTHAVTFEEVAKEWLGAKDWMPITKTGFIGVPEATDGGINVQCLLNPLIKIGQRVQTSRSTRSKTCRAKQPLPTRHRHARRLLPRHDCRVHR